MIPASRFIGDVDAANLAGLVSTTSVTATIEASNHRIQEPPISASLRTSSPPPAEHGGQCDARLANAYVPNKELQSELRDRVAFMHAVEIARAPCLPTAVIRDGWDDDTEAD